MVLPSEICLSAGTSNSPFACSGLFPSLVPQAAAGIVSSWADEAVWRGVRQKITSSQPLSGHGESRPEDIMKNGEAHPLGWSGCM